MRRFLQWTAFAVVLIGCYAVWKAVFGFEENTGARGAVAKPASRPMDVLSFPRAALERSIPLSDFSDRKRDQICEEKWERVVFESTDVLLNDLAKGEFDKESECAIQEKAMGILDGIQRECTHHLIDAELPIGCQREAELYRARLIDRMIPDSIGFDAMSYEVAINKLLLIPYDIRHDKTDAHLFEKAVGLLDTLIRDSPEIRVYRRMKLQNMALLSGWNPKRLSEGEWREFLWDYEEVYGWDVTLLAAHMYVNDLFSRSSENASIAGEYMTLFPTQCAGYYYAARSAKLGGDMDESVSLAKKCLALEPESGMAQALEGFVGGETARSFGFPYVDAANRKVFYTTEFQGGGGA